MALIKSPLFDGLWGKIGDLEFRMRKNKKIELAKKRIPMDRKSEAQLKQRERYKNCLQQYYKLTPEQLKQYEEIGRKQKLDAFRAFMAECLKAPLRLTFDNDGGGTWNRYINIPLTAAPAEYAQYKIELNGDTISVYSADGTLKTQGTGMTDFWNNVKTDGADIRAFDNNKNQLYFYIETFDYANQQAVIWVRVEANITELNIAYGNPSAMKSTYENGSMVFDFFDDFEGTELDTTKWNVIDATGFCISNSLLKGTNTSGVIHSITSFTPQTWGYTLEVLLKPVANATNGFTAGGFYKSAIDGLTYLKHLNSDYIRNDDTWNKLESEKMALNVFNKLIVTAKPDGTVDVKVIRTDTGVTTYQATLINTVSDEVIRLGRRADDNLTGQAYEAYWDWVRVLKLADPASFGTPAIITI